jgi:hypothetical protein
LPASSSSPESKEGIPLQAILAKVGARLLRSRVSKKIRMASPNLLRAISPKHNPTQQTLDHLLRPFGPQLSVKKIASASKRHAAQQACQNYRMSHAQLPRLGPDRDHAARVRRGSAPPPGSDPGENTDQDRTKREFMAQWIEAVNEDGGFGRWPARSP